MYQRPQILLCIGFCALFDIGVGALFGIIRLCDESFGQVFEKYVRELETKALCV
jgi:hypothetical protein